MKTSYLFICFLFLFCAVLATACSNAGSTNDIVATTAPNLQEVITHLPQAAGYQTYKENCLICHSASYVQNQPALPETKWTAVVTKMQKTFGAPVSDSAAQVIVKYLVSIKGKP